MLVAEEGVDNGALLPEAVVPATIIAATGFLSEFSDLGLSPAELAMVYEINSPEYIRVVGQFNLIRAAAAFEDGAAPSEGVRLPTSDFRLRQAMYMFDGQGELITGQDEAVVKRAGPEAEEATVGIMDLSGDWINPMLAWWDEDAGELVTVEDAIYSYNGLSADFESLRYMSLAIIDDISTRVSEIIYDDAGGTVKTAAGELALILDIPAGSAGDDIEVYITEVKFKDHLEAIAGTQGKLIIDGQIYDFRAVRISDGSRVGTVGDPFDGPVTITLEVPEGSENPTISWFNYEMGLWEEIETVRVDATHISADIYHFSKWAVFDLVDSA